MIVVRAVAYPQRQKQGITDADLYMIRKRTSIIEDKKDINSHFLKKKVEKQVKSARTALVQSVFIFNTSKKFINCRPVQSKLLKGFSPTIKHS